MNELLQDPTGLVHLAVAALGGLAVGIEREWSAKRDEPNSRFAGMRTFLLLGLIGGLASRLMAIEPRLGVAVLAAAGLLTAIAYFVTAWRGTVDATTEVAAIVVLAAGALAGAGELASASAVFAGTALVLVEKSRMHAVVERLRSVELEAAARFAVLALVVLPLLPGEPIATLGGLAPRRLWGIVLLFAGLSFAGYVALRAAGPQRGYGIAGLLGGVVSSTAVTLQFARASREPGSPAASLAFGALAASAVLPLRVALLSAALELGVARALLPAIALPLVAGAVAVARSLLRRARASEEVRDSLLPSNPLRLGSAIQMTLLFAVVLVGLSLARDRFGASGLVGGAVLLGLTDLDALTYSMTQLAGSGTPVALAARGLVIGMLANSLFKLAVAMAFGAPRFRWIAGAGLLVYAATFAVGLAF